MKKKAEAIALIIEFIPSMNWDQCLAVMMVGRDGKLVFLPAL